MLGRGCIWIRIFRHLEQGGGISKYSVSYCETKQSITSEWLLKSRIHLPHLHKLIKAWNIYFAILLCYILFVDEGVWLRDYWVGRSPMRKFLFHFSRNIMSKIIYIFSFYVFEIRGNWIDQNKQTKFNLSPGVDLCHELLCNKRNSKTLSLIAFRCMVC